MSDQSDNSSIHSIFSTDGDPYSISLTQLEGALGVQLRKLAEGGNHKIYDIVIAGEENIKHILRVPYPDFPIDKLESEVATLQFIAANTSVPVPKVLGWSSDPSNRAGTEYMILEKIPGVSAYAAWDTLTKEAKERLVRDVAECLLSLFNLRFSQAGSLCFTQGIAVQVGPLVSIPFFRAKDGEVRFPQSDPLDLSQFRGPFTRAIDRISSGLRAELHVLEHRRNELLEEFKGDEARLDLGDRVLKKAIKLAEVYPGEQVIGHSASDITHPFSIKLADFRLPNVMIDEGSGKVLGLIDFEGTTTAPLWMCAVLPYWLEDDEDNGAAKNQDLAHLRGIFNETIKAHGKVGEEWLEASEKGQLFRNFSRLLEHEVQVWAEPSLERWVDERLAFAAKNPGVGMPEETLEEMVRRWVGE